MRSYLSMCDRISLCLEPLLFLCFLFTWQWRSVISKKRMRESVKREQEFHFAALLPVIVLYWTFLNYQCLWFLPTLCNLSTPAVLWSGNSRGKRSVAQSHRLCIWCTVLTRFWKPTLANLVLGDCKCTSPGHCYHHAKLLLPPMRRGTLHHFKGNMGCFLASVFVFFFFQVAVNPTRYDWQQMWLSVNVSD